MLLNKTGIDTDRTSNIAADRLSDDGKMRKPTPGYIGPESMREFYKKFKQLDRELEENSEGYSASTAYLSKVNALKLLPSPIGLIHK